MSLASVLASFWKAFGIHLVSFFGIIFCIHFGIAFSGFLDPFGATPGDFFALLDHKGSPRGIQKHPARSPFWHFGAAARPEASKTSPVALKTSSVELKTGPVQRATAHFGTHCDWMLKGFGIHLGCFRYVFGTDILWLCNELVLSSVFQWNAFKRIHKLT